MNITVTSETGGQATAYLGFEYVCINCGRTNQIFKLRPCGKKYAKVLCHQCEHTEIFTVNISEVNLQDKNNDD